MTIQLSDLHRASAILARINTLNQEINDLQKVAQSLIDGKSQAKMDLTVINMEDVKKQQMASVDEDDMPDISSPQFNPFEWYIKASGYQPHIPFIMDLKPLPTQSSFQINESEALLVLNVLSDQKKSERAMLMAKLKLIGVNI